MLYTDNVKKFETLNDDNFLSIMDEIKTSKNYYVNGHNKIDLVLMQKILNLNSKNKNNYPKKKHSII